MTAEPYCNDVYYLRFCLSNDYTSSKERMQAFQKNLQWRTQEGKTICDSARLAVLHAFSSSSHEEEEEEWDYDEVQKHVPNVGMNKFLTPAHVRTIVTPQKDVVFVMKHGLIQDKAIMKSFLEQDVVDFMMYAKEVNFLVANRHSLRQDRLAFVLTANDLHGASLARGDAKFRAALNNSARLAAQHYPSVTGPTLMLNLPSWLTSIARAFAPSEVSHTLKFAQGPLRNVNSLMDIAEDGPERTLFFQNLNELVYSAP